MNTGVARGVFALVAVVVVGCGSQARHHEPGGGRLSEAGGGSDGERGPGAGAASPEVARAIADQHDRLEVIDREIAAARGLVNDDATGDPALVETLLALEHDRVAGRSFLAHLERCVAGELACPTRLDEPALPAAYDPATGEVRGEIGAAATWPAVASELAAAACACRTRSCVGWVMAELDRWETALSARDADAGDAGVSVTTARGCLWARLGR